MHTAWNIHANFRCVWFAFWFDKNSYCSFTRTNIQTYEVLFDSKTSLVSFKFPFFCFVNLCKRRKISQEQKQNIHCWQSHFLLLIYKLLQLQRRIKQHAGAGGKSSFLFLTFNDKVHQKKTKSLIRIDPLKLREKLSSVVNIYRFLWWLFRTLKNPKHMCYYLCHKST